MHNRTLIAGIGNILRSDDGVGVQAIRQLEEEHLPLGVDTLFVESSPLALVCHAGDYQHMILVDAMKAQQCPGRVHRFTEKELASYCPHLTSLHQISILDVVTLIRAQNPQIKFTFIAVEIATSEWGEGLSPVVTRAIPAVLRQLRVEIGGESTRCSS